MKLRRIILPAVILLTAVCASPRLVAQEPQPAEQPAVISAVAPFYPPIAKAARATGEATVMVKVNASGEVGAASFEKGHPLFKVTCEQTAKRWKFAAAARPEGERTARLTFVFRLTEKDADPSEITPIFSPPYRVEVTAIIPVLDRVNTH